MRFTLRRLSAALALLILVQSTRPVPAPAQQNTPEVRLFFCAVTCLWHAIDGQCSGRTNDQCVAWYAGCMQGCMFLI